MPIHFKTLTYWAARSPDPKIAHTLRARIRRELVDEIAEMEACGSGKYGPPTKVTVQYAGAFDLLNSALRGRFETDLPTAVDRLIAAAPPIAVAESLAPEPPRCKWCGEMPAAQGKELCDGCEQLAQTR